MTFICSGMRRAVQFGGRFLLAVGANEEATNARTRSSLAPSCDVDVLPVTAWETRGAETLVEQILELSTQARTRVAYQFVSEIRVPHFPASTSAQAVPEQRSHGLSVSFSSAEPSLVCSERVGRGTWSSVPPEGLTVVGGIVAGSLDLSLFPLSSKRESAALGIISRSSFSRAPSGDSSGASLKVSPNVSASKSVNIPKNPLSPRVAGAKCGISIVRTTEFDAAAPARPGVATAAARTCEENATC